MQIPDWLAQQAARHPHRPALICAGTIFTFAELNRWTGTVAAHLQQIVSPGARVALLARNQAAFAAIVHAAPRARITLIPLNTRLTAAELAFQIRDSTPALLVVDHDLLPLARDAAYTCPIVTLEELTTSTTTQPLPAPPVDLDAPHTIIYTSGTTGRPKGAILTAGNHWWNAIGSLINLGLHDDDRWLAVLPLFHVGGLSILLRGAIYGMPVVLHERFDPALVRRELSEQRITIVSLVAVMLQRLLAIDQAPFPPHLRCVLLGGGPIPQTLLKQCAERGIPVTQTYGMSEAASQAATLAPHEALQRLGSAGKPLLPVELRIITPSGQIAAPGEIGEICLRGPTISPGYLGSPLRRPDEWFHTGDLGYLDSEGYLYVVDRRSDLIITGGENVYPAEIEAVLLSHPAVSEAGVVGLPDPEWGQRPVAAVVCRQPITTDDLIAYCRTQLASYKVPRTIVFVDELPRTAAGKLRRYELRAWLQARAQRSGNESPSAWV
ncbi:o-succinylbenzoate--CoA ligase [Chloroflexus sp. MS-G]|uniref:o-succinylbenzoate--CoA ligase n=1 Tax=Chloroflexus sp. MS-G TaxID=1521187 RepID=UPI0004DF3298|nr:o-succinylbenzoate--CoA ligase [Chloroflexus sp. MS-G]